MIERRLPDVPERPLDRETLSALLHDAMAELMDKLRGVTPATLARTIYRPNEGGWASAAHDSPAYFQEPVREAALAARALPACTKLLDYLWDHGACPNTFYRDDDIPPERRAWDLATFMDRVYVPLGTALERAAIEMIVDTDRFDAWDLPSGTLDAVVSTVTRELADGRIEVRALCPIFSPTLPSSEWSVAPDIKIRTFSQRDICVFLTVFGDEFIWSDAVFGAGLVMMVEGDVARGTQQVNDAMTLVTAAIDLTKWALCSVTGAEQAFLETAIVIEGPLHRRMAVLRRGTRFGAAMANVQGDALSVASTLIERFRAVRSISTDLDEVLWLYGRAAVAPLARDVLLDSVIALETLLVDGPGESTYKFALHGVAILGSEHPELLRKSLREIYAERSKIAHGSRQADLDKRAIEARRQLVTALSRTIELIESGALPVKECGGDIARAVTTLVLRRAALASTQHG